MKFKFLIFILIGINFIVNAQNALESHIIVNNHRFKQFPFEWSINNCRKEGSKLVVELSVFNLSSDHRWIDLKSGEYLYYYAEQQRYKSWTSYIKPKEDCKIDIIPPRETREIVIIFDSWPKQHLNNLNLQLGGNVLLRHLDLEKEVNMKTDDLCQDDKSIEEPKYLSESDSISSIPGKEEPEKGNLANTQIQDKKDLQNKELKGDSIADSLYKFGVLLEEGVGTEQNYQDAFKCYHIAAEMGHLDAMFKTGNCYRNGLGINKNLNEAIKYYRLAADKGHSNSQNTLGVCFEKGIGVEKNYKEAVKYYRSAAEQKNAKAMCNLGYCYENGLGVEPNLKEAVHYYRLAAEQGNPIAQCNLGSLYESGQGVEQNYSKAAEYYRMAAEQGDDQAMFFLGMCYVKGNGVSQNFVEAIKYFQQAADKGNEEAKKKLESLSN